MAVGVREGADGAVAVVEVVMLFARAREADDLGQDLSVIWSQNLTDHTNRV